MKLDGTDKQVVINKGVRDFNISKDYIFYTERTSGLLFGKKKDMTKEVALFDLSVEHINIIGNRIYCWDTSEAHKFYNIPMDGK